MGKEGRMKRDTIVRLLSFCLILAALSTMTAGLLVCRTARRTRNKELDTSGRIREYLDEYAVLLIQTESSDDYETLNLRLSRKEYRYESRMTRHREELALFTASRSGMKQGEEALRQAEKELQSGKQTYLLVDNLFAMLETVFEPVYYLIDLVNSLSPEDREQVLEDVIAYLRGINLDELNTKLQDALRELENSPDLQGEYVYYLNLLSGLLTELNYWLENPYNLAEELDQSFDTLVAIADMLQMARITMDYIGWQITEREEELKKARGTIREEQEKLDEQAREMEKEKAYLDSEETALILLRQQTDEQKVREDRLKAIRSFLQSIPEIKERMDNREDETEAVQRGTGGEKNESVKAGDEQLVCASEDWYSLLTETSRIIYTKRMACAILMFLQVLCASTGFAISFRQRRKKGIQTLLFLICLLAAVAAEFLFIQERGGISYSNAAVAAVSALCLGFSCTREKEISGTE